MQKIYINDVEIILNTRPIQSKMDDDTWSRLKPEDQKKYLTLNYSERQLEWAEAHRALFEIFDNYPEVDKNSYSLSHSWWGARGMTVAAATSTSKISIGVDLENCQRKISDSLMKNAFTSAELLYELKPISLWTIKEACFKANPLENKAEHFNSYQIKYFNPELNKGEVECSQLDSSLVFQLVEDQDWQIAVAISI